MMRNQTLLGTIIIAVFSLILAMPVAALANHLLGFEGFSIGRFVWLNLSLGALVMVAIGAPLAAAVRRRQVRAAARVGAVPARAKVISVREVPVQSKRIGVRVTLEVALPDGGHLEVVSPTWLVRKVDRPRLAPGTELAVKVDPARPREVFAGEAWLQEDEVRYAASK